MAGLTKIKSSGIGPGCDLDGSGTLVLDTTNGRVGIETASPARNFTVNGGSSEVVAQFTNSTSGTGADDGFQILHFTNGNTQLLNREDGELSFYTNNNPRMAITSGGNVGIGTTAPETTLHVEKSLSHSSTFYANADAHILIDNPSTESTAKTVLKLEKDSAIVYGGGSSSLIISDRQNERMRIDSSGRVGIGTTSPSSELHVQGALSGGQLLVASSSTNSAEKYGTIGTVHYTNAEQPALGLAVQSNSNDNHVLIGGALGEFNAATNIRFYTAANNTTTTGSERARIDSSGNVGIGETSPDTRLHLKASTTGATGIFIQNSNGSTNSSADLYFGNWSGSSTTTPQARIQALNTNVNTAATDLAFWTYSGNDSLERLRITSNGNVQIPVNAGTGTNRLQLGASQQFQILQDTSNGFLANDDLIIANKVISENIARFKANGAVTLYHNNGQKFETTTNGVNISGSIEFNSGGANNRLDDYEEGTWTPALNLTSLSYASQSGTYTKIGNLVYATCYIDVGTISTHGSNAVQVSGFPFATENTSNVYYAGTFGNYRSIDLPSDAKSLVFNMGAGASHATMRVLKDNASFDTLLGPGITDGTTFYASFTYRTNS